MPERRRSTPTGRVSSSWSGGTSAPGLWPTARRAGAAAPVTNPPLPLLTPLRGVASWRPDDGVLALGVGLAAAGMGAVLGLAAERIAVARVLRPQVEPDQPGDGRGGPALGSVRGVPRMVFSENVPLHVEVDEPDSAGTGITVVLSHGYALTLDSWHYQRLAFRGRYRLVLWDQRGHGRSGAGPIGSSSIDQSGADLAAVIEAVAPTGPLVLLGHSMGGMTVMSLAAQRPDLFAERVLAVGLISTSATGEVDLGLSGVGRLMMSVAPSVARILARQPRLVAHGRRLGSDLEGLLVRHYSFASAVPPQLINFAAGMIAQTRMEVLSDFLPTFNQHDKREALATLLGHEVLVMVGDRDLLTPAQKADSIVALLPDAEHVVVQHAGHLLPLEHPDLVNAHLEDLLAEAEAIGRETARATRRRGWGRRTLIPVRGRWPRRRPHRSTESRADRTSDRTSDHSADLSPDLSSDLAAEVGGDLSTDKGSS